MPSTVSTDDDTAIVSVERMYVPLARLTAFDAPGDWAEVARSYYGADEKDPAFFLFAMMGNALSFAAQGRDDMAMASLWQALTMIKDAAMEQARQAMLTEQPAAAVPAANVDAEVTAYVEWSQLRLLDPDEVNTLREYERGGRIGRAGADRIADALYIGGGEPSWRTARTL